MQRVLLSIITHFLLKTELEIYTLPNHAFSPDQRRIPGANPMEAKKSCRAETDRPCVYDVF